MHIVESQDNTVTPRALLCDYSHSTLRESPEIKSSSERRGGPRYAAPELLKPTSASEGKTDPSETHEDTPPKSLEDVLDETDDEDVAAETGKDVQPAMYGDVWSWGMTILVRT